jgi:hypothetical protein
MAITDWLLALLNDWGRRRRTVAGHRKQQAYGPAWGQHRPRWIDPYPRRRQRRR